YPLRASARDAEPDRLGHGHGALPPGAAGSCMCLCSRSASAGAVSIGPAQTKRWDSSWTPTSEPLSISAAIPGSISTTDPETRARERAGAHRLDPIFGPSPSTGGFEPRLCRPYRAQTKGKVEADGEVLQRQLTARSRVRR